MGAALEGSGRPLVITSALGFPPPPGRVNTEEDSPAPSVMPRALSEQLALALASRRVRSSVVRLAPSVHGEGDHAFLPALIAIARAKQASAYIGEGRNRWAAVHRLDAAQLFRLALEKGAPGSLFHGVGDEGIATREIAEAIGRRLQLPVVSKSRDDAAAHFGWLAGFFALDVAASSARTREQLGWQPRQPGLLADLERDHYFGS